MAKHKRRSHLPSKRSAWSGGRKRLRIWLLEGGIVLLAGINLYFLYSVFAASTSLSYQTNLPLPEPPRTSEGIQIEVLNGCGEKGISNQVRKYLREKGFDVVHIGNADNFNFPETVVLDRIGNQSISDAAKSVALSLGTPHIILQRNDDRMVDVTAIIGQDFERLRSSEE